MRIAHFTDLHLRSATPGSSAAGRRISREVFQMFHGELLKLKDHRVDFIAVTGDLVDVPHFLIDGVPRGFTMPEGDSPFWRECVRADYVAVKEALDATGIPYSVMPGNHDWPELFFEVFPADPPIKEVGGYQIVTFNDYEQEHHVPRRLTPSFDLFKKLTSEQGGLPQIHLQHYLLNRVENTDYPFTYPEADYLREKIHEHGNVALSLSGHYHEGLGPICENGTYYAVTPGFCTAGHQWRIYELRDGNLLVEEQKAVEESKLQRVVFLDRDGVINDLAAYTTGPEAMRLIPGSAEAIRMLNERGIKVIAATSQAAIGLGYVTEAVVRMVNERMHELLAREGAFLDAVYYTRGAGEYSILPGWNTFATKKSTLLLQAAKDRPLDLSTAWIVGDRITDMEAGAEAGTRSILVRTGWGRKQEQNRPADASYPVVEDLRAAVERILDNE